MAAPGAPRLATPPHLLTPAAVKAHASRVVGASYAATLVQRAEEVLPKLRTPTVTASGEDADTAVLTLAAPCAPSEAGAAPYTVTLRLGPGGAVAHACTCPYAAPRTPGEGGRGRGRGRGGGAGAGRGTDGSPKVAPGVATPPPPPEAGIVPTPSLPRPLPPGPGGPRVCKHVLALMIWRVRALGNGGEGGVGGGSPLPPSPAPSPGPAPALAPEEAAPAAVRWRPAWMAGKGGQGGTGGVGVVVSPAPVPAAPVPARPQSPAAAQPSPPPTQPSPPVAGQPSLPADARLSLPPEAWQSASSDDPLAAWRQRGSGGTAAPLPSPPATQADLGTVLPHVQPAAAAPPAALPTRQKRPRSPSPKEFPFEYRDRPAQRANLMHRE